MKRALSLIMVLAMVLCMIPAVVAAEETLLSFTDKAVTADEPYVWTWTATADGTLKVEATPEYAAGQAYACWKTVIYASQGGEKVYEEGSYQVPNDPWGSPNSEYEVTAGQYVTITFGAQKAYVDYAGTISGKVTFGGEATAVVTEMAFVTEEPITTTGEHTVTPLANTTWSMYIFTPTEIGKYTIAVDAGNTGYMGAGSWFTFVPSAPAASFEQEIKSVGNSIIFGVQEGATKVTITKSGESEGIQTHTYVPWKNKVTPDANITIPSLTEVDITESHTAVKISDSEYRLDSANGPILYVDLEDSEWSLAETMTSALTVRSEYDGGYYNWRAPLSEYSLGGDYNYGMGAYYDVMKNTGGVYPLTTDLYAFINGWGKSQGWFGASTSPFADVQAGTAAAGTEWMVVCYYDAASEILPDPLESGDYILKTTIDSTDYYAGAHNGKKDMTPVTAEADAAVYTITVSEDGKTATIVDADGKYMTCPGSNSVTATDTAFSWDVTANSDGTYSFSCSEHTRYMAMNTYGGLYWRTYTKENIDKYTTYDATIELIPYVAPEPVPGESAENPIVLVPGNDGTIDYTTAAQTAGTPVYYAVNRVQGYVLTVTGEGDFTVTYNGTDYTAVNGVVTIDPFSAPNNYTPAIIAIDGTGTLNINIEPPKGTWDNPDELKIGENSATLEENSMGYYWTYTADEDGTLIFTVDPVANTSGYSISANNGTTYANVTLDLDNGLTKGELAVSAGDVISVSANTLDLNSWDLPAGTVIFNVALGHDCVDSDGPDYEYFNDWSGYYLVEYCDICKEELSRETWYYIQDQDYDTADVEFTTISVAAGESINLYGNYAISGTTMTMDAGNSTVVIDGYTLTANNGVYTYEGFSTYGSEIVITNNGSSAATYTLVFVIPEGTWENPEQIVVGESYEHTFDNADDAWNGYYYTYTADCAGTLVLDFTGETWSYVIEDANYNQSIGDNCLGDNSHVEIALAEGETINILLSSTAADDYGWTNGTAGTTGFAASFKHDPAELIAVEGFAGDDHNYGLKDYWYCGNCGEICDETGAAITDTDSLIEVPAHIDSIEWVEKVNATASKDGMKEHYYCSECDTYMVEKEDEDGLIVLVEVTKDSLIIPATGTEKHGDTTSVVALVALVVMSVMGIATVTVLKKRSIA